MASPILPRNLPAASSVAADGAFIVDTGAAVQKATPAQIVDSAIPLASQGEAEAGVNNVKRMTPLRTKQAIDALGVSAANLSSTTGAGMVGWISSAVGAVARTISSKVGGYVDVEDFGAIGDGTTDDTEAWTKAIAFVNGKGLRLRATSSSYLVSIITFDGSDYSVETNGCLFIQKAGTVDASPACVRFIGAERVFCGSFRVLGNIATDPDEYHHAATISMCKNVSVGNIYGTDIRGDVLYCYARNTSEAEMQRGVYVASVSGTNVYRNLLTVVGGQAHVGQVIHDGPVGYRDFDVEPNNASGTYEAVDLQIDHARVGSAEITSDDAALINLSVQIGSLNADLDLVTATTPPYPGAPGAGAYALGVSRTANVAIGYFKARNYNGWAINLATGWGFLDIGYFDVADCNKSGANPNAIIYQLGDAGAGKVSIKSLSFDGNSTTYLARVQNDGLLNIEVGKSTLFKGLVGGPLTGRICDSVFDHDDSDGYAFVFCENLTLDNVGNTGGALATGFGECDRITFNNSTLTYGTLQTTSANFVTINSSLNGSTDDGIDLPLGGNYRISGVPIP